FFQTCIKYGSVQYISSIVNADSAAFFHFGAITLFFYDVKQTRFCLGGIQIIFSNIILNNFNIGIGLLLLTRFEQVIEVVLENLFLQYFYHANTDRYILSQS